MPFLRRSGIHDRAGTSESGILGGWKPTGSAMHGQVRGARRKNAGHDSYLAARRALLNSGSIAGFKKVPETSP